MIRQAKATDCMCSTIVVYYLYAAHDFCVDCLACRLFITCCVLRPDPSVWPSAIQLSGQTEGILWIMKKPMPDDVDSLSAKSTLQSQVFFSSSEYAVIPRFAIDLLPPMMDKIEGIWKKNFSVFSNRLASMVRIM